MTWDGNGKRIRRACARNGARGFRHADAPGELGIRDCLSGWYLAQRLPNASLKRSPTYVERQMQAHARRIDESDDRGNDPFELAIATNQTCPRKLILQIVNERLRIVAQRDRTDAPLALRDEYGAERAFAYGELDRDIGAARTVITRPHAEQLARTLVETTVRPIPSVIDRRGDTRTLAKTLA